MVQFGEKFWFHKFGEEGINSAVKSGIPGIFVGLIQQEKFKNIAKGGIVRGPSGTRQTLRDAWEPTIMEDLFVNPGHRQLHTAIAETKLTKNFITDEEGTNRLLPRIVAEKTLEVERRRFYVLSADIEAYEHVGSCPGYVLLASQGKVTKPRRDEFRERVGTTIEKTTGEARMDTCKDRIAERSEELELSEMQWMCARNLGTKMMSRWRLHHGTFCNPVIEN